jgi:Domain of unknown function (DUF4190)
MTIKYDEPELAMIVDVVGDTITTSNNINRTDNQCGTTTTVEDTTAPSNHTDPPPQLPLANILSFLSLILGILSITTLFLGIFFGPLAILTGLFARRRIPHEEPLLMVRAPCMARTGIIWGCVGIFIYLPLFLKCYLGGTKYG